MSRNAAIIEELEVEIDRLRAALARFVNHCEAHGIPARADSLVQIEQAHAEARAVLSNETALPCHDLAPN